MAFDRNRGSGFTYRKTPVLLSQRTTFPSMFCGPSDPEVKISLLSLNMTVKFSFYISIDMLNASYQVLI